MKIGKHFIENENYIQKCKKTSFKFYKMLELKNALAHSNDVK